MANDRKPLATEAVDDRYSELDVWPLERTIAEIIDSNRHAVETVANALPQLTAAAEAIAPKIEGGGRLVYAGAGTSGRLATQDAAELRPTFGFDRTLVLMAGGARAGSQAIEGAEDETGRAEAAVAEAAVDANDVLIGIAASGATPYTLAAVRTARARGAVTVGIANNNEGAPLLEAAQFPILLATGPEVLAGSTRLAAGTAQKIALNALSTSVMVRVGGAYRNLMVGMTPTNEKLRRRAAAIVELATGASAQTCEAALAEAGGAIAVAIVMIEADVSHAEARERLESSGGRVREALKGR